MSNEEIISAIRSEVERLHGEHCSREYTDEAGIVLEELEDILSELSEKAKGPVCEELVKEAVNYCFDNGLNLSPRVATDFARHFAEWKKSQMMKGAVEGYVSSMKGDSLGCVTSIPTDKVRGLYVASKVKLIIIKEDEK